MDSGRIGSHDDDRLTASGGWCAPVVESYSSPVLSVPTVSVRRGGIVWPKRAHIVRRYGWRWAVMVTQSGMSDVIEARFWRFGAAARLAKILNRIEVDAVNA